MKFEGKKSPRGPQRDNLLRIKGKSIAFDDAFLGGSSTWARTRDLRINSPALYRLSYRGIYKKDCSKIILWLSICRLFSDKSQIVPGAFSLEASMNEGVDMAIVGGRG